MVPNDQKKFDWQFTTLLGYFRKFTRLSCLTIFGVMGAIYCFMLYRVFRMVTKHLPLCIYKEVKGAFEVMVHINVDVRAKNGPQIVKHWSRL